MRASRTTVEEFDDGTTIERASPIAAGGAVTFERPLRRPRNGVEILDLALAVLRDRFPTFVLTCAALWIPVSILQVTSVASAEALLDPAAALVSLFGSLTASLVGLLVTLLAHAFVAILVMGELTGRSLTLREALPLALRRTPAIVVVAIVIALLSIPAVLACLFPVLLVRWKMSIAPSICAVERVGIGTSIARSFALTRGTFLRWLCVATLTYLFEMSIATLSAVSLFPGVREALPSAGIPLALFDAGLVLVTSLFMGVALAVGAVTMTVFYDDCRLRAEGTDLAQRLDGLQLEPAR
ncbi:MAG: hypothetical protein ACKVWV_11780 [Planctomycetota bacterium]